jgi:outer membrane lipoprotein-sorting protein
MTTRSRSVARLVAIPAAILIGAASLGCGFISNVIDTANALGEFSERLGKAQQLTYTAVYTTDTGDEVTLAQQPPNSSYADKDARFIITADHMMVCDNDSPGGKLVCNRVPNSAGAATGDEAAALSAALGGGFIPPELALSLVAAAALVPGSDVETNERKVGGLDSLCADVTGLEGAAAEGEETPLKDFSVCVADNGVLTSFKGTLTDGEEAKIELKSFSTKVDPKAFTAPAGAKVVDVDQLPTN